MPPQDRGRSRTAGALDDLQLHPLAAKLIERAQAAGQVRDDATTQDFGVVLVMVAAVMDAAADVDPELWRR